MNSWKWQLNPVSTSDPDCCVLEYLYILKDFNLSKVSGEWLKVGFICPKLLTGNPEILHLLGKGSHWYHSRKKNSKWRHSNFHWNLLELLIFCRIKRTMIFCGVALNKMHLCIRASKLDVINLQPSKNQIFFQVKESEGLGLHFPSNSMLVAKRLKVYF